MRVEGASGSEITHRSPLINAGYSLTGYFQAGNQQTLIWEKKNPRKKEGQRTKRGGAERDSPGQEKHSLGLCPPSPQPSDPHTSNYIAVSKTEPIIAKLEGKFKPWSWR